MRVEIELDEERRTNGDGGSERSAAGGEDRIDGAGEEHREVIGRSIGEEKVSCKTTPGESAVGGSSLCSSVSRLTGESGVKRLVGFKFWPGDAETAREEDRVLRILEVVGGE